MLFSCLVVDFYFWSLPLLETPPAAAPTINNVVKVIKIVFDDADEQEIVSSKDPKEKLTRFEF